MNSELVKSLNVLIDETLEELEELKKSRFSASEIKLDGPGSDGIAGKPANGSMGKKDEKEEKEEDEDEAEKAEGTNEEAEKAEGTNEEAEKSDSDEDEDEEEAEKADKDEEDEDEKKDDKKEMEMKMKKSQKEMTSLMKSFVDERIKPLEDKLSTIFDLVNKIADQPVAPRGFTARAAVPLSKSSDEFTETLSKASVTTKLWELKKSGTPVDSLDVTKAEMGQDLESIAKKYKIS